MKANIFDLKGAKTKSIELPVQFEEEYRPDLISRAVLVIEANTRQAFGSMPNSGDGYASKLSRRRKDYKTAYGKGISRTPRKTMTRRGGQFFWVGASAPGTVGGRSAHPPKAEKKFEKELNRKERRKAIRSAVAATANKELVKKRGHIFEEVPIIIKSEFETLDKTKQVKETLKNLGLKKELDRVSEKKIRAVRGKARGRKYKIKKGPLIVVSGDCKLEKSAAAIVGVNVVKVNLLNAKLLAPGSIGGRLCIWSEKAIERMTKEKLFLNIKKTKENKK